MGGGGERAKLFGEFCVPLKKSWLRPWSPSSKRERKTLQEEGIMKGGKLDETPKREIDSASEELACENIQERGE